MNFKMYHHFYLILLGTEINSDVKGRKYSKTKVENRSIEEHFEEHQLQFHDSFM